MNQQLHRPDENQVMQDIAQDPAQVNTHFHPFFVVVVVDNGSISFNTVFVMCSYLDV